MELLCTLGVSSYTLSMFYYCFLINCLLGIGILVLMTIYNCYLKNVAVFSWWDSVCNVFCIDFLSTVVKFCPRFCLTICCFRLFCSWQNAFLQHDFVDCRTWSLHLPLGWKLSVRFLFFCPLLHVYVGSLIHPTMSSVVAVEVNKLLDLMSSCQLWSLSVQISPRVTNAVC